MTDRQQILDGLVSEQTLLRSELAGKQEEFEKLRKRINEIEHLMSALDVVIKGLNSNTPLTVVTVGDNERSQPDTIKDEQVFQLRPSDERAKQDRPSLRGIGRDHFGELSQEFTKNDVADLLLKYHTELNGTVNENSLRNVVKQFIDLGWARIKVHSVGKTPQIYEKIL